MKNLKLFLPVLTTSQLAVVLLALPFVSNALEQ